MEFQILMSGKMKYSLYILLGLLGLSSCTKIIDIELNSALQRLVIEARITDQDIPATVYLSRTMDYFNPDEPEKVSGAKVSLSTDSGEMEILEETSEGVYQAAQIKGINGVKYFLNVEDGEQVYEASSILPNKVLIDSLEYEPSFIFNPRDTAVGYLLGCWFTDPAEQANYYSLNVIKTPIDTVRQEYGPPGSANSKFLVNDVNFNGIHSSVNLNRQGLFHPGDTVFVELISINQNTYIYLDQLNEISGGGMMFSSSAPANPENNFSNGAMGFFTAEAIDKQMVIIEER